MKYALILVVSCCVFKSPAALEVVNQWNLLDYNFPPDFDTKNFIPENAAFTGLEITDHRFFIAIPRLRSGVPATLAWIPKNTPKGSSPILQAYPDWSYHGAGQGQYNCSGIISVYRARLDSCNRLWVLDAGTVNSLENFMRPCNPKLLVFDLTNDQIVRTVVFPDDVVRPASIFTNLVIDESVQGKCDSAFVYITDTVAPGIVVLDGATDKTWRFSDPPLFPNPDYANSNIGGEQFALMDGVIGLAHSPKSATVFFQAVATDRIFSCPTDALRKGPPSEFEVLPISTAGKKSSQGLALAMNQNDDTLLFSPFTETSVASWNIQTNKQDILAVDPVALQFVADIRWKQDDTIYVMSSRFHRFFRRTVSPNEINLRIMTISPKRNVINNNIFRGDNNIYGRDTIYPNRGFNTYRGFPFTNYYY